MILWLQAIEDFLVNTPGNADSASDWGVWESVVTRLNCWTVAEARDKVFWDLLEADRIEQELPFFVLKSVEQTWQTPGMNGYPFGAIDIFYAEQAFDPDGLGELPGGALEHKRALERFAGWWEALMAHLADNANTGGLPTIASLQEVIEPQRTPRDQRDRDDPKSDYWWTCWRVTIGASP